MKAIREIFGEFGGRSLRFSCIGAINGSFEICFHHGKFTSDLAKKSQHHLYIFGAIKTKKSTVWVKFLILLLLYYDGDLKRKKWWKNLTGYFKYQKKKKIIRKGLNKFGYANVSLEKEKNEKIKKNKGCQLKGLRVTRISTSHCTIQIGFHHSQLTSDLFPPKNNNKIKRKIFFFKIKKFCPFSRGLSENVL